MGTATTKVSTLSNALKSAALNMGIMLAATLAIQGVVWVFDKLNVTIEEQEEVVNGLTDKLSDLKGEYDELSGKDKLTYEEEQKLDKYRFCSIMSARKLIH